MAAAAELPKPGVEVIQQLRTVTPQIVAPTLAPTVMGVCKQIIEVLNDDNTVNSDALVSAPAVATTPNSQASYNLNGDSLIVSINDGPDQTFAFVGVDPLTATQAASQINGATVPPSGFAAYAVNLGTIASPDWRLQLRTVGSGASMKLKLVGGTSLSDFGWGSRVGWTFYGLGAYSNYAEYIPQASFPDPRGIIDELDIDEETIRVFVDLGTEVREILRSESFLRKGAETAPTNAVTPFDDGDGDATTPYVSLTNATVAPNLLATALAADTGVGNVDLSADVAPHNLNLTLAIDGSHPQTLVLTGQPIVSVDTAGFAWANVQSNVLVLIVNGSTVTVTFSAGVADIATLVSEINAAVALVLGAGTVVAYRCNQWGDENAAGTYVGFFYAGAPSTNVVPNTSVKVEDSTGGSTALCVVEIFGIDQDYYQWNRFSKQNAAQPIGGIDDQIDGLWGGNVAWIDGANFLYLQSTSIGEESTIWVDANSSALTVLGFAAQAGWHYGGAFPLRVGDALYADGASLGSIIEIHSQGQAGRVKLDAEVALLYSATTWYIVAKNLDTVDSSLYGVTHATPDLQIDTAGAIILKHHFMRDTTGTIVGSGAVSLYVAYEALRLDVTSEAEDPGLLAFDDVDDLDEALGPLVPENPLAYGLYLAMQNAAAVRVYGIGVSEYTSDKPYGTVEGWTKAYDFLETHGVYALAPMTDDLESHLVGRTHVLAMSQPEEKGERVIHFYLGRPDREADDIVVSGNNGDKITATTFDTKVPTLSQALLALGIDPANITVEDGVFLDIASDALNYNITGALGGGTIVTINTTFVGDQNVDNFFSTTDLTALTLISESFSVKVRGATISNDTDAEIATIIARGTAFASRRCRMAQLDGLKATINGVEQLIPGFFINAAKVGQIGGNPPSTPYTNFPITGFTGVTGTDKIYTQTQMNQGAAGGAEWFVQTLEGVPLVSRHQVTTDLTSVETTEQSITNALDYVSIFMRTGLRNFIGRYNISDTFLDTLASVVQGQLQWLMDHKVIAGGDLNNIIQDESNPTRVLIDCTIQPFYPCNYIRLTLVV